MPRAREGRYSLVVHTSFAELARDPIFVPAAFLLVSTFGAAFALNAHRPLARGGPLSISVFFAGWLTSELPLHHLAWQILATAAFAWAGALASWPGWVGLGLTFVSWAALLDLYGKARRADVIVERALVEALGSGYRARAQAALLEHVPPEPALAELALPFSMGRADVERIRNLPYGAFGHRNKLDVYRRRDRPERCPVLISVHGGAWIIGDKSQQAQPLLNHLAAQGWVCVAINYRLSPRSTFPDHLVDVKRAIAWVKENIAEYGGDPGFVAISGGSAGGHLCSLAALTPDDREGAPDLEGKDLSVNACVPFYGVYDFTNRSGLGRSDLRRFLERLVMKRPFGEARAAYDRASPMSHVHPGAPPFLVVHGTNDTLVPVAEARLFVEMLREVSRAPVAYVELPQAQHAFEVFSSMRAAHVVRGVARFLAWVYGERLRTRQAEGVRTLAAAEGAREIAPEARVGTA